MGSEEPSLSSQAPQTFQGLVFTCVQLELAFCPGGAILSSLKVPLITLWATLSPFEAPLGQFWAPLGQFGALFNQCGASLSLFRAPLFTLEF